MSATQLAELSQLRAQVQDIREKLQHLYSQSEDGSRLEAQLDAAVTHAASLHVVLGRARDAVQP